MLKDAENCQIAPGFTRIVIHGMVLVQRPFSDTGLHAVRGENGVYGNKIYQMQLSTLSQQQQQSLRLLQCSAPELDAYVYQEYLSNPLCELRQRERPLPSAGPGREAADSGGSSRPEPSVPSFENSWRLALKEQLYDGRCRDVERLECMVELLDRHGFLPYTDEELARLLGGSPQRCRRDRERLRQLDPAGVGSLDLPDYLLFQLESRGDDLSPQMRTFLSVYVPRLDQLSLGEIARRMGVEAAQVRRWRMALADLRPHPVEESGEQGGYILPELLVEQVEGRCVVRWQEEGAWAPVVSPYCADYLQGAASEEERAYIRENAQRVRWLVSAVEQRRRTVLRIGEEIAARQQAFFQGGMLRAVPQAAVADALGIHKSTVSRAIAGKYLTCRRGTFPLKLFFTAGVSALEGGEQGGEISRESVKRELQRLIGQEDWGRPYSDDKLAALLRQGGLDISRRTVAKYRGECGIRCAAERRKLG